MVSFRNGSRRYFHTGGSSAYIGAANRISVITRRSRPAFSKIKQIYGDHMEALNLSHHELRPGHPVAAELRKKVLSEIKKDNARFFRKQLLAAIISFLTLAFVLIIAWRIILLFYPNFI